MAKRKSSRDPFEVKLSDDQLKELKLFLHRELDYVIMARMNVVGDNGLLDKSWDKYRGGDPALTKDTPWPGAANLGSYIVTLYVDSMKARIMSTIFTDPIWVVEGFGKAAERAPLVEEFHQWKADQTKLPQAVGRAVLNALVEGTGILEVADRVSLRRSIRNIRAKLQTDPQTGLVVLDEKGQPIVMRSPTGHYVEVESAQEPHQEMIATDVVRSTAGPSYRTPSMKDFYVFPGHAADMEEVWGYAKRFYRRLSELKQREDQGYYKNVDDLGGESSSERLQGTAGISDQERLLQQGQDIAPQQAEETSEKELWELTLLLDLDEDGYDEWYIITWSQLHQTVLRVQYQNYDTPQYILLTPYPRPNSIWGYSLAKDKLGSLYDEHTAVRNMFMDRMNLKTNAPIMQMDAGLWNPSIHPWAPGKRIPVRQMDELKQMEVADVPNSVPLKEKEVLSAAQQVVGLNDVTTGQMASVDHTLGEVKTAAQQSWIRIDEVVKNMQQGFEDLFQILNTIWQEKLKAEPEPWPGDLLISMQQRAIDISDPMITADVLAGAFRGKPRGSVEASDFNQMRADIVQMITAITQLSQRVPALEMQLNNPQTIRSILTQIARVYRWPDRMNLVGNFTGQPPPPPPQPPPGQGPMRPGGGQPRRPLPAAPNHPPMGVPGVSNPPNLPQ